MSDMKKLDSHELEQVSGGWEFDGPRDWLVGHDIVCPYCGNGRRDVVTFTGSTSKSSAYFKCLDCKRMFIYSHLRGKIELFDDQLKPIK